MTIEQIDRTIIRRATKEYRLLKVRCSCKETKPYEWENPVLILGEEHEAQCENHEIWSKAYLRAEKEFQHHAVQTSFSF